MPGVTVSDTLLIAATIAGPILAVQAQKFIERAGEQRRLKLHIFYMLMSTRATRIANEHVQALNLIELEFNEGWFHKRGREKLVVDAWRLHLDSSETSFIELMYAMAQALGYDFDRVHLRRGIYYSRGQGELELAQRAALHHLVKVLAGQQPLAVNVVGIPIDKEAAERQAKIQDQYLKTLTGEAALHVLMANEKKERGTQR
jgi:hypothetical protein